MPFAPSYFASFVLPGAGQMLQGRLGIGSCHAVFTVGLTLAGIVTMQPLWGLAALALGIWSSREAYGWRKQNPPRPAAAVEEVSGPPMVARWRRRVELTALVILQLLAALGIALLLVAAGCSFMIFDAPGSENRLDFWAFVVAMNVLPLVAAYACFFAWGLHGRGRTGWALATMAGIATASLLLMGLLLDPVVLG